MSVDVVQMYALCEPETLEIRYVGKAKSAQKRFKQHLRESRRLDYPVYRWMRKLARGGQTPALLVLEECPSEQWQARERALIETHRGRLLNVAAGGDEPFCATSVRASNGRKVAAAIHSDPVRRKSWEVRQRTASAVRYFERNGMMFAAYKLRFFCGVAKSAAPELLGDFVV